VGWPRWFLSRWHKKRKKKERERAHVGQAAWAKWPCSLLHDREDRLEGVVLAWTCRDAGGRQTEAIGKKGGRG
jgi:hypothetical protein